MLKEAIKEQEDDEIIYEIQAFSKINEEDKYGGFRVNILCKMENIRLVVPLDIATGDIITPHPINYKYISSFGKEDILIKAYPLETMVAEKIQTIFARGFLNSRSKDFYDLYIICKLKEKEMDVETLKRACRRTFEYRKTELDADKIINFMEELKTNEYFLKRWQAYLKKNIYAAEIPFREVLDNGIKIISKIK